jgi:hypothetical protein
MDLLKTVSDAALAMADIMVERPLGTANIMA